MRPEPAVSASDAPGVLEALRDALQRGVAVSVTVNLDS